MRRFSTYLTILFCAVLFFSPIPRLFAAAVEADMLDPKFTASTKPEGGHPQDEGHYNTKLT